MEEDNIIDCYPTIGKCPICESEDIEYNNSIADCAGLTYDCECNKCGTKWNECYDLVFAGNFGIIDKDGNKYEDLYA